MYIRPVHKSYCNEFSCHTSDIVSENNCKDDLENMDERELTHNDLKNALLKRDGVCLFCWRSESLQGAHIITHKNIRIPDDESFIYKRVGLSQKHQVQNGMLLCIMCHRLFAKLKRYLDFVDDKLVVKVVNETNDKSH